MYIPTGTITFIGVPASSILQLFRVYNTLILDTEPSSSMINEIIENYQQYDPEGLVGFGVSLANAGYVQQALKINEQKLGAPVQGDTWNQYFEQFLQYIYALAFFFLRLLILHG